jgi:hypothetical protein
MRIFFLVILLTGFRAAAQENLLVYAVRGNVTAIYNSTEIPVKIGKVLMPGTTLRLQKNASMTMLCKRGKPLNVEGEGEYPLANWKDSCKAPKVSLTSNYFSYIWSEFYTYSPEHREELRKNELAVTRGNDEKKTANQATKKLSIDFSREMDTVNYAGKDFPLSWTCFTYNGNYIFKLYDEKGVRLLFTDSSTDNFRMISQLKSVIQPGKSYRWTISAPKAGFIRKRVLNFTSQQTIDDYIDQLQSPTDFAENAAGQYFRTAYMLERKHYLADALAFYEKAAATDPSIDLYRDRLIKFRNEFWIR